MKAFMDKNFLLSTESARRLYHEYAAALPIIDYHCHIDPREIAEDKRFSNLAQLWLKGDHYKWRQMRSNGVAEYYITGEAPEREKFQKWAETLEKAPGNPLYHWSHLELQRYFGYDGQLNAATAEAVWTLCEEQLRSADLSVKNLIRRSNVELICTTDDPADSLEWHDKIKDDRSFQTRVLPTWRPDKAMNLEKPDYLDYLARLSEASRLAIRSFADLTAALKKRMDFFGERGCLLSDHGPEFVMFRPATDAEVEGLFAKRLRGETLSREEELKFKTRFLLVMAREYSRRAWVMQMHYGCKRDNHRLRLAQLGVDTGFDCIGNQAPAAELADFLNALCEVEALPKTILYSLNPNDNALLGTLIGCFQDASTVGKIQQGSAWWFNDHIAGMRSQLISLANLGLLGNFVGMLTDSRSFLSYVRHEYFRRILCELVGSWVEAGEFPNDAALLEKTIVNICHDNAERYFSFNQTQ